MIDSYDVRDMKRGLLVDEMAVAMEGDINTCCVMVYLRNISVELFDKL
jgi:hypothetical protein